MVASVGLRITAVAQRRRICHVRLRSLTDALTLRTSITPCRSSYSSYDCKHDNYMNNIRSEEANVSFPSGPPAMQPHKPHLGDHDISNRDTVIPSATPESLLPDTQLPLQELCARIHERIEKFLGEEFADEGLRRVQSQTRTSLKVIEEALERYRLVSFLP
jgi:hypothetical protein